jgi:hypothetical protein
MSVVSTADLFFSDLFIGGCRVLYNNPVAFPWLRPAPAQFIPDPAD